MAAIMNTRIVLLIVVALTISAIAWRHSQQTAVASNGEKPMVDVKVPKLDGHMQAGKAHYDTNCAACHGSNASGLNGAGPPLVHKIYEPSHHSDEAFRIAVKRGVRAHHWSFGDMMAVEGLTDSQIEAIIGFIRALQRANGIE